MPRLFVAAAFAAFSIGTAAAQINAPSDAPATEAYMKAMQSMDDKMKSMTPSGDPSKDFVMMMAPHHGAAVDMAEAYLKYGKDPELVRMARNIITSQKTEIKEMNAWQAKHGM